MLATGADSQDTRKLSEWTERRSGILRRFHTALLDPALRDLEAYSRPE